MTASLDFFHPRRGEYLPEELLYAIAGVANRFSGQRVNIEFVYYEVHPEYDATEYDALNDLAILETRRPIKFNDRVKPICIANENMGSLLLSRVAAVGWGQTNRNMSDPQLPDTVQFVNQKGDSGGPLVYNIRGTPVLVGITKSVSVDLGCGHLLGLSVFTRISSYTKYINDTAEGDVCFV
ncbi:hypothetical protein JTE90_012644 [Oedothorax gibbosus]|uniref:Peptidase S1 domain-containing protein n=1 Tax=Oedothorax gibbosus TaxID=931172 RepID=A0AAV6ULQ8_9ARAC|nr:hypothetical protein JTE90_012644 [Oedothorax gibbosus]